MTRYREVRKEDDSAIKKGQGRPAPSSSVRAAMQFPVWNPTQLGALLHRLSSGGTSLLHSRHALGASFSTAAAVVLAIMKHSLSQIDLI